MIGETLSSRRVFTDLRPAPKAELLGEITRRLAALGDFDDPAEIAALLVRREEMISTGVKEGLAFPHAFSPKLRALTLTVGLVREGTDYQSIDGRPVRAIFLVLGPTNRQDIHLRLLARLSRLTAEPGMVAALCEAGGPEEVLSLLQDADRVT